MDSKIATKGNRRRLLVVLSLAALPAFAQAYPADDGNAGLAALEQGDNAKAITLFTRVLASPSVSSDDKEFAYFSRGKAYLNSGKAKEAEADLHNALQLKPDDNDARQALQAAIEVRREAVVGSRQKVSQPVAPAAGLDRWGYLRSMIGRYWSCASATKTMFIRQDWGPDSATIKETMVQKGGHKRELTYKLDPLAGVLFGFTYKGVAIYGVADVGATGDTSFMDLNGVPVRQKTVFTSPQAFMQTDEAWSDRKWQAVGQTRCSEVTQQEVSQTSWARKLLSQGTR